MSAGTRAAAPPAKRATVTLSKLAEKKALGEPIVMVTAYDYPSAQVAEAAGVDVHDAVVAVDVDDLRLICVEL